MRRDTILLLAAFAVALLAASPLFAHDGWEWIARDPRYVAPNGTTHCCSEDCREVEASALVEHDDGVSVEGFKLYHRHPGIYWALDGKPRVCRWSDGRPRCIFRPQPGS